jgi:hypothetical protein
MCKNAQEQKITENRKKGPLSYSGQNEESKGGINQQKKHDD